MEIFRKYRKLENQLNFWNWVGRIAPLVALVIVIFLITFQFNTLLVYTIGFISIAFACIAFIWWWWVIQTIHDFLKLKNYASGKFKEIKKELESIKIDLHKSKSIRKKEHNILKK